MPERYRHGAEGKQHEPEKKVVQAPIELKTPTVPAPALPPKPAVPKKKRSSTKIILIAGVVVLLVLGVGGYFLVKSVGNKVEEVVQVDEVVEVVPEPEPEPQPEPEPGPEPEAVDPFAIEVSPGTDSDSDGLSDTEEKTVYGTNPRLPDSDADGFLDGNEVFHRYNPASTGTLLEAGVVVLETATVGTSESIDYTFTYPGVWDASADGDVLVLDAQTGEGFRISSVTKNPEETLEAWVKNMTTLEDPLVGTTKNGLVMLSSQNQLMTYVDLGFAVLVMEYDTGTKARVNYLQTMQMMLNSVEVKEVAEMEKVDEVNL